MIKKSVLVFLHILKVLAWNVQQAEFFGSNFKRKTVYPLFSFDGPPLLGAVPTDKLSAIWIEEKVTSFSH